MEFLTFTLPNGIRCIHKRVRSSVAHCALTVNAGSRDELAGEHGIAHLAEHTIFKGTEHRRAFHINSRLENLGGELNAFTTKEDTAIHATTLKGDFSKAAELIADIIFHSTFPEHEVEREKQVVIDEINTYRDIPQEMIYDRFEALLFPDSPLGLNILGTKQSVKKFNGAAVKKFISRTYTPDQMVFSAVGNISEKNFVKVAERYFGGIPASERTFQRIGPPTYEPFEVIGPKNGNHQAHCIIGNRAYSLADSRRLPLSLLVNILGGPSANSRLNTVLRERNGLSYNIEAGYQPFTDTGSVSIYFSCDRDKVGRCRELIDAELSRMTETMMTPRQLSMAKKQCAGQFSISMDGNEGYMLGAAKSFMVYNEIDSPQTVCRKINAITAAEIMDVARDVFNNTSIVVYR